MKNKKNITKNKRPLVLAINCNVSSGGGNVMLSLAELARVNGYNVVTAAPEGKNNIVTKNHIIITKRWQKALNWRLSKLVGDDLFIPFNQTGKLIKFIDTYKPSIIHIHGLHGYYINYIKLLNYLDEKKIPIVWTQHDCWSFTGKCPNYSEINCFKWKTQCVNCPQLKQFPASMFHDNTTKMYERKKRRFSSMSNCTFVPVSKWLQKEMSESFLAKMNIRLISNGVDTSIFRPQRKIITKQYGIHRKKIILGVAASWTKKKGLEDFFELNKLIDKRNTVIVLIGVNKKLSERCKDAGIISILKTADKNELAQWYSSCDVLFNPSIEETFGLVTVEAMSCGTPIVGYLTTATKLLLENTPNFCIEPHDMEAVKEAINHILTQPREIFSEANRKLALEKYDLYTQYMNYMDLYDDLLHTSTE